MRRPLCNSRLMKSMHSNRNKWKESMKKWLRKSLINMMMRISERKLSRIFRLKFKHLNDKKVIMTRMTNLVILSLSKMPEKKDWLRTKNKLINSLKSWKKIKQLNKKTWTHRCQIKVMQIHLKVKNNNQRNKELLEDLLERKCSKTMIMWTHIHRKNRIILNHS